MSKKSRRRARRARERDDPIVITQDHWRQFLAAADAMPAMVLKAFQFVSNELPPLVERMSLGVAVMGNAEWGPVVVDALQRGDSLPLMVYADWCDENGLGQRAAMARRVAAVMTKGVPQ